MLPVLNERCKMTALIELAFEEKRSLNTNLRVGQLVTAFCSKQSELWGYYEQCARAGLFGR